MNAQQLRQIMPGLPLAHANEYADAVTAAMSEGGITTALRQAAFLAQCAYESNQMNQWREASDGSAYEGRIDLGNTEPGDGRKYPGRGLIMVTGRDNYTRCGQALGLPLLDQPELLEQCPTGIRSSIWFWNDRWLSILADHPDDPFGDDNPRLSHRCWDEITKRINGEFTEDYPSFQRIRTEFYLRARAALGVAT